MSNGPQKHDLDWERLQFSRYPTHCHWVSLVACRIQTQLGSRNSPIALLRVPAITLFLLFTEQKLSTHMKCKIISTLYSFSLVSKLYAFLLNHKWLANCLQSPIASDIYMQSFKTVFYSHSPKLSHS